MKTVKPWLIAGLVSATLISVASATEMRGGGSGGTTGGGDYLISAYNLLPKKLEIRATYRLDSHSPAIPVGSKRCWNMIPCTAYAQSLELKTTFDLNSFIAQPLKQAWALTAANGDLQIKLTGTWAFQSSSAPVVPPFVDDHGEPAGFNGHSLALILPNQKTGGYQFLENYGAYFTDDVPIMYHQALVGFEAVWDGTPLDGRVFSKKVNDVEALILGQVSLTNDATIANLAVIDRFEDVMLLPSVQSTFNQLVLDEVKKESTQIEDLARKSVTDGNLCEPEAYLQLIEAIKHRQIGTKSYFDHIRKDLNWNIDLDNRLQKQASDLMTQSAPSVMRALVACSTVAAPLSGDDLRLLLQ